MPVHCAVGDWRVIKAGIAFTKRLHDADHKGNESTEHMDGMQPRQDAKRKLIQRLRRRRELDLSNGEPDARLINEKRDAKSKGQEEHDKKPLSIVAANLPASALKHDARRQEKQRADPQLARKSGMGVGSPRAGLDGDQQTSEQTSGKQDGERTKKHPHAK